MEFVRPDLAPDVLTTTAVYRLKEGEEALVAGWPIARQHPKGQEGTVFVTIEDEEGDVQLILWPTVFARRRRQLQSRIILARGVVSRWDGPHQPGRLGPAGHRPAGVPCPPPTTGTDSPLMVSPEPVERLRTSPTLCRREKEQSKGPAWKDKAFAE